LDLSLVETLRELGIPDAKGQIVTRLHDAFTSPEWRPAYPESRAVLEAFHESGIPVQIVSNSTDMLMETIARRGWDRFLRGVTFSQEAGAEKPDRAVFDLALTRADCTPRDVVHVGDSWTADYLGASRIGIRAIWLNRQEVSPPESCESIHDLTGVLPLLRK
jgi:putative hydrolase of the HAD superfamily